MSPQHVAWLRVEDFDKALELAGAPARVVATMDTGAAAATDAGGVIPSSPDSGDTPPSQSAGFAFETMEAMGVTPSRLALAIASCLDETDFLRFRKRLIRFVVWRVACGVWRVSGP